MSDFEKHIRENRHLFDEHKADSDKIWAEIESSLNEQSHSVKTVRLWRSPLFKIAATIVVALGFVTMVNTYITNQSVDNSIANQELLDIDTHYKYLVSYQVNLVNKNAKLTVDEKKEFLMFMEDLEEEYQELRKELHKNFNAERVLEAIVINYKKQIELIENLLKQINNSEKMEDDYAYIL